MRYIFIFLVTLILTVPIVSATTITEDDIEKYAVLYSYTEDKFPKNSEFENHKFIQNLLFLAISKSSDTQRESIKRIYAISNETLNKYVDDVVFIKPENFNINNNEYFIDFQKWVVEIEIPTYIEKIIQQPTVRFRILNEKREFLFNESIYRVNHDKYYLITPELVDRFLTKSWLVTYFEGIGFVFIDDFTFIKKNSYNQLSTEYKHVIVWDNWMRLIEWDYYGYFFNKFNFFEDSFWVYDSSLEASKLYRDNTLLYYDYESVRFITDYTQTLIAKKEDIFWFPNKNIFLEEIYNDKKKYDTNDVFSILSEIENLTYKIIEWKDTDESIFAIFDWVSKNIEYPNDIVVAVQDPKNLSALETFKRKSWIERNRLIAYMLLFAWIEEIEYMKWFKINSIDFPNFWSSWLKIWDMYYDHIENWELLYAPYDIFYLDRYNYKDIPSSLFQANKKDLDMLIFKKASLLDKWVIDQNYNYPIFDEFNFRNTYNIPFESEIDISTLKEAIWYNTVLNNSFYYIDSDSGKNTEIKRLNYYNINDLSIQSVLKHINYDLNGYKLFYWELKDGNKVWRLGYNIKY